MSGEPRASRFVHGAGPHAGKERRIRVSFEFFPPKTEEMEKTLWDSITRLAPLEPNFVSVTYGAGGSTRERTHATVKRILAETALVPAAHLTCVAATREEIDGVIRNYCAAGVRHIVALRGDPVGGIDERYAPHPRLVRVLPAEDRRDGEDAVGLDHAARSARTELRLRHLRRRRLHT